MHKHKLMLVVICIVTKIQTSCCDLEMLESFDRSVSVFKKKVFWKIRIICLLIITTDRQSQSKLFVIEQMYVYLGNATLREIVFKDLKF